MRILYHHRTRAEDAQGIHIHALCDAFRSLGHSVEVVALVGQRPPSAGKPEPSKAEGAPAESDSRPVLLGLPIPYWLYEVMALAYNVPAFFWLLWRGLRTRPTFIYERYTLFTFAGWLVARVLRVPFILEVNAPLSLELQTHGNLTFRRLAERLENALCARSTRTLVVTQAMADIFIARGVPAERLEVIPNGVDGSRFHPTVSGETVRRRYQLEGCRVIGFVGWIRPWHGVDGLIQAATRLMNHHADLRLLIVGDGPAIPALREQANATGFADRIIFTGPVAREEIPQHIAALDVAVQPDVTEYASPIKLFEYLALGRTVIAPDRPNIREVVTQDESALLFPPRDWDAMEKSLAMLLDDPNHRDQLAANAAQLVETRGYTWVGNAERVVGMVAANGWCRPRLVVFSRVFPNTTQPTFGVFVRERMFRVAEALPVVVVAPVAWFPGQGLIRRFLKPDFRPPVPYHEVQEGIDVYHPRFLCVPGILKWTDGFFLALGTLPLMRRLRRDFGFDIIDAHFVYPDGVAAWLLGRWLRRPYTITLRGTIFRISRNRLRRWLSARAMSAATRVFSVSESLRQVALGMNQPPEHVQVVPNGINLDYFYPEDRARCRDELGLPQDASVLITVGTLNERKGFHRVIEQIPGLLEAHPNLHYLCVGGGSPDGNDLERLQQQARDLGVADRVHFTGAVPPEALRTYYSAADVFVLATRFEGWANVFLEAAACGLPSVTTRVGGNAEVITSEELGLLVPFGDPDALRVAIDDALKREWNVDRIREHATSQSWEQRIPVLVDAFTGITHASG